MQTTETPYFRDGSKLYQGRYIDVMPALLKDRLTPISPASVMDARNKAVGTGNQDSLWNIYYDTDFGLAADSKKVYLFPHSKELRKVSAETELIANGIQIKNTSGAKVFKRKDLKLNERLTEKEARSHPLWDAIAENKGRLDSYVQNTFKLGKDKFNYAEMMGFYVPNDSKPILRAVVLDRLYNWSYAGGSRDLVNGDARLVGVRSSASAVSASTQNNGHLESRISEALKQGVAFEHNGLLYVPVNPEVVQKIK